jgi:hypothetical protein
VEAAASDQIGRKANNTIKHDQRIECADFTIEIPLDRARSVVQMRKAEQG